MRLYEHHQPVDLLTLSEELKKKDEQKDTASAVGQRRKFLSGAAGAGAVALGFPMIADYNKTLSSELGILHPVAGAPLRATYIVDPEGIVRYALVSAGSVGRSVKETLRVVEALQSGELCQMEWEPGKESLGKA